LGDDEIDHPLDPVAGLQVGENEGALAPHPLCVALHDIEKFRTKAVGSSKAVASTKPGPLRDFNRDEAFKVALDQSIDATTAESGRANFGAVGNHLLKLLPDFDPRNYGFRS
jgi:OST-HTH/LOTUS domain